MSPSKCRAASNYCKRALQSAKLDYAVKQGSLNIQETWFSWLIAGFK